MEMQIKTIGVLLIIAAIVAMIARRFQFPYTVGLLFAGISLSLLHFIPSFEPTKELIFSLLLPPLTITPLMRKLGLLEKDADDASH